MDDEDEVAVIGAICKIGGVDEPTTQQLITVGSVEAARKVAAATLWDCTPRGKPPADELETTICLRILKELESEPKLCTRSDSDMDLIGEYLLSARLVFLEYLVTFTMEGFDPLRTYAVVTGDFDVRDIIIRLLEAGRWPRQWLNIFYKPDPELIAWNLLDEAFDRSAIWLTSAGEECQKVLSWPTPDFCGQLCQELLPTVTVSTKSVLEIPGLLPLVGEPLPVNGLDVEPAHVVGEPSDLGTKAKSSTERTKTSRRWTQQCTDVRDKWFEAMESPPGKWIPSKTFIRKFLQGKQPTSRPRERWTEKWREQTPEGIYQRFKANVSEWKHKAAELKERFKQ